MEDTDEDFFDKLVDDVDDHYKITSSSSGKATELANVNDSDKAKACAHSSVRDDRNALKESQKVGGGEEDNKASSTISGGLKDESTENRVDPGQSLVSSVSYSFDNVSEEPNNGVGLAGRLDSTASGYHGTGGASGVKEVQWSAFTAGALDNSSNGFESFSDFFTEFGDNLVDQTGKVDSFVNSEPNSIGNSLHAERVNDYSHQFQEGQSYTTSGRQSMDGQDMNSSQYWENLYPGWRYDANTGQWYQVDEGYDATANAQGMDDSSSEAAYLQQTTQSFVGGCSRQRHK